MKMRQSKLFSDKTNSSNRFTSRIFRQELNPLSHYKTCTQHNIDELNRKERKREKQREKYIERIGYSLVKFSFFMSSMKKSLETKSRCLLNNYPTRKKQTMLNVFMGKENDRHIRINFHCILSLVYIDTQRMSSHLREAAKIVEGIRLNPGEMSYVS